MIDVTTHFDRSKVSGVRCQETEVLTSYTKQRFRQDNRTGLTGFFSEQDIILLIQPAGAKHFCESWFILSKNKAVMPLYTKHQIQILS
jgi:hypothetical protein